MLCVKAAYKGYGVITLKERVSNVQNIPLYPIPRHNMGLSQKSFQGAGLQHTNEVSVPEYVYQMLTRRMEKWTSCLKKKKKKKKWKQTNGQKHSHIPRVSVRAKENPCKRVGWTRWCLIFDQDISIMMWCFMNQQG